MPTINGTTSDDVLVGTPDPDVINGLEGNDTIYGGGGGDEMRGGPGNDVYVVHNAGDVIAEFQPDGNDIVFASVSYVLNTVMFGEYVETLSTIQHSDTAPINLNANGKRVTTIYGNYGNNILEGVFQNGTMIGLRGDDTYFVTTTNNHIIEAAGEGNDAVYASANFTLDAGQSVEAIAVRDPNSTTAINLTGNELGQTITGNRGNNILDSGAGGMDVLIGGDGNDTFHVRTGTVQVVEAVGGGTDGIVAYLDFDLRSVANVENLAAAAGTAPINLYGNAQANFLNGNQGDNILDGGGGGDTLNGGGGNDIYRIRSQSDFMIDGAGTDIVFVDFSYRLQDAVQIEVLSTLQHSGTANIDLTGNEFSQTIYGNYGNNVLGTGLGGNDTLIGLLGDDTYIVNVRGTQIIEQAGQGSETVFASTTYELTLGSSVEVLSTIAHTATTAIDLTGNELVQTVYGNFGANVLDGGGGNDTLIGFSGADTFRFSTAPGAGNIDTITDFSVADDTIALHNAFFAVGGPGALNPNAFVTGTAAGDADDRIIYNQATGALFYDADGNGAGAAVQFATLLGMPVLTASDFIVIDSL